MVNGNSGFFPRSYYEMIERVRDFPDERAMQYLRARGVTHLGVHGAFYYDERRFRQVAEQLDARAESRDGRVHALGWKRVAVVSFREVMSGAAAANEQV